MEQVTAGRRLLSRRLLRSMGSVIAPGQSPIESGTPHSLSDQLAYVESYWQLNKAGLVIRAWPEDNSSADFTREQKAANLLQAMLRDTGIRFLDEDAGRFGNVEVVRFPAGSYDMPSGLRVQTSRSASPSGAHEVLVWLTAPLAEQGAMNIGCRLYNGGGITNETLILDEVRPWPPADGGVLRFQTAEPISTCEVSVWSFVSHQILAREKFGVVRGIGLNVRVAQESRRIISPWVRKLSSRALQDQAAKVDKVENLQSRHLRGLSDDPWVEAERHWRSELDPFRPSAEAAFFQVTQDQEVKLMDFLRDLIDASDVERAVIVDPYFDTEALAKLPLRLQSARNVVAITSCLEEAKPDPGKGLLGLWGVISNWLRHLRRPSEAAISPCQALVTACDQSRKQLPSGFKIISVENEARSAKQFHDRYILLELSQGERVWMLSNSFNSIGRHYPATVTRLPAPVAAKVRGYLKDLEDRRREDRRGKERSDAKVRTIWEQPSQMPQHAAPTHSGGPLGLELFPGWQNILRSLAPAEKDDASRARAAVQSGQFTMNGDVLTWFVPTESVPLVVQQIQETMAPAGVPSTDAWTSLAQWAYHGGPDARSYAFATSMLDAVSDRLRDLLAQAEATERVDIPDLSGSSTMDVCFRRAASIWEHAAWLRVRRDPVAGFSVEYLWHHAPEKTIGMIEQHKSWPLLAWLLNHLGYSHSEEDARRFLSSKSGFLQALGLAMVWTDQGQSKWSQGMVARCRSLMSECSVSPEDSFLMTTRLAVETWVKTQDAVALQEVGACWPADGMSEQLRDRFQSGVSDAARMHLVQAGVELLAVCPVLADARWMRQSLIESVLGRFPYKRETHPAYRPGGQGPHIYRETDGPATDLVARLLWEQHGDGTVDWCMANVLEKLAFGKINSQLLRARDYSLWTALADGLSWGIFLCAAVVDAAPYAGAAHRSHSAHGRRDS